MTWDSSFHCSSSMAANVPTTFSKSSNSLGTLRLSFSSVQTMTLNLFCPERSAFLEPSLQIATMWLLYEDLPAISPTCNCRSLISAQLCFHLRSYASPCFVFGILRTQI